MVILTSELAYRNTPSLHGSINNDPLILGVGGMKKISQYHCFISHNGYLIIFPFTWNYFCLLSTIKHHFLLRLTSTLDFGKGPSTFLHVSCCSLNKITLISLFAQLPVCAHMPLLLGKGCCLTGLQVYLLPFAFIKSILLLLFITI